jgi:hypothetical protein
MEERFDALLEQLAVITDDVQKSARSSFVVLSLTEDLK